ncbi:hypothetical protein KP509_07G037600 [Ceratopteris richardii]|uniref:Receptor-like serine/threonine-protein kinase n=1 Tax=Ceratopteris richardii TaxID=49495 RepID=A0A8T2UBF2_CERRI|nr:hypothetical protein KP509_07G037600 [Ceratopteris richardii]
MVSPAPSQAPFPFRTVSLAVSLVVSCMITCNAAERFYFEPGWSFEADLSFPSSPSALNSYKEIAPFSLFVPILNSSHFDSGSKGYSAGFISLFESPSSSPSRIFLVICLGQPSRVGTRPFLVPVWSLNSGRPLEQQEGGFVKLQLLEDRQILLLDGYGKEVWRVENVGSMEMQNNGNLIIYGMEKQTLWQSFDNPSDTLVQGQKLTLGMELSSNNNMYKVEMKEGGLWFYQISDYDWPLAYWIYPANDSLALYFDDMVNAFSLNSNASLNITASMSSATCRGTARYDPSQAYTLLDLNTLIVVDACSNSYTEEQPASMDFVRLDIDGILRVYRLQEFDSNSGYAIASPTSGYHPCSVPNVCGNYGICSLSNPFGARVMRNCRCPSEVDNKNLWGTFSFIDPDNPSQGCLRTEALKCDELTTQSMEPISGVTYMSILPLFEQTWQQNTMPLEVCKIACLSNCSCSGFFYHNPTSYCLQFGESTALSNVSLYSLASDDHFAFVKVQKRHTEKSKSYSTIIAISVAVPAILIVLVALAAYWMMHKREMDPELKHAEEELLGILLNPPIRYSYSDLKAYTKNFRTKLGSGGFGSVYEGRLPDGRNVAVKKLELLSHGQKEFLAEIATIGSIQHVNIVRLYGFCLEKHHRLLVYEYLQNGSLDRWLYSHGENTHVLSPKTRLNIALGTARGLAYLHEECPKPILHLDVKPRNILLDENFDAKLADFGLAKLVRTGESSVNTAVRGTPGYIAPECLLLSTVSKKSDVYSFGMVLLELVSGRKNIEPDLMGNEEYNFPKFAAKKAMAGKFIELMDKRLLTSTEYVEEDGYLALFKKMISVAILCIQEDPKLRPTMLVVSAMLEGNIDLPHDIPEVSISENTLFDVTSSSTPYLGSLSSIEGR